MFYDNSLYVFNMVHLLLLITAQIYIQRIVCWCIALFRYDREKMNSWIRHTSHFVVKHQYTLYSKYCPIGSVPVWTKNWQIFIKNTSLKIKKKNFIKIFIFSWLATLKLCGFCLCKPNYSFKMENWGTVEWAFNNCNNALQFKVISIVKLYKIY